MQLKHPLTYQTRISNIDGAKIYQAVTPTSEVITPPYPSE
jgi:hypothetical protein